jgi:transposase
LKPWKKQQWVIAPEHNGEFVASMEQVLAVYRRPYDALHPLICMDESPRQLIRETRVALAASCRAVERVDYEYERCGVCNVFMAVEPLAGKRVVEITERKAKTDWALFLQQISEHYNQAERITLVMDNLSTHSPGALYETFAPTTAKTLRDRFDFIYTPKHGSWLNMAEIELNVLIRQCLNRRIGDINEMQAEVAAWQKNRNNAQSRIDWQFTCENAQIKLKRLYPTVAA